MANSTRIIGLFLIAVLFVGTASGQDFPSSNWDDELPQEMPLPQSGPVMGFDASQDQSLVVGQPLDASAPFEGYQDPGLIPDLHAPFPAPIESTGTWLRRGFWYAETDAVIWNRLWNRDDKLMAAADPQVEDPNFFSPFNPARQFITNRLMYLESTHPGEDGSVRATLGHFFFRDSRNRDHTAEFTAMGGGDWQQDRVITSEQNFGLFVPFYIDGNNPSFDQSTRQTNRYGSDYTSFEANYRVRQRLGRDRLVMDPNGCWHRDANPGFEREFLAGLRFIELGEQLDWRAEDIFNGTNTELGNDGRYYINTDNDLFGFQLGTGLTYQSKRWSLGINCKGGIYINDASGATSLDFTINDDDPDVVNNDYSNFFREDELSMQGEARLLGRFHITPNFSLRAAYELMFVESVALAPSQATFIPEFAFLETSGDPFYHGASFGFEGYW